MNGLSAPMTKRFQPIWFPPLRFFSDWKLDSAEPSLLAAGRGRAQLGDDHPDTLLSINNLGMLLETQGKLVEAEPLLRECLQKCPALRASAWPQKDQFMLTFCKLKIHYPRGKPWFDGWFGGRQKMHALNLLSLYRSAMLGVFWEVMA